MTMTASLVQGSRRTAAGCRVDPSRGCVPEFKNLSPAGVRKRTVRGTVRSLFGPDVHRPATAESSPARPASEPPTQGPSASSRHGIGILMHDKDIEVTVDIDLPTIMASGISGNALLPKLAIRE